jgi:protein tyrosine/serine phosphatase
MNFNLKKFILLVLLAPFGQTFAMQKIKSFFISEPEKSQTVAFQRLKVITNHIQPKPIDNRIVLQNKNSDNFYAVQDGFLYRTKTLPAATLDSYIKEHGIKTILNVRAEDLEGFWLQEEKRIAERNGTQLITIPINADALPTKEELKQIFNVLLKSNMPILVHCYRGADRTGMICALWVLEKMNGSLEDALAQLNKFYNHKEWHFPQMKLFIKWWHEQRKSKSFQEMLNYYDQITFLKSVQEQLRIKKA